MSISTALATFEWQQRKVNLLDTPGDSSFIADALGALRVCESAVFVINAVMGVEVHTTRLWQRAAELDLARLIFVNMLDRERADFFRTLESLKSAYGPHVVATEIPIGSEHETDGVIDLVDMKGYAYQGAGKDNCTEIPIPAELESQAQEYREKLMDEVAEGSDALMERYLEGEEISHEEIVAALKEGTNHGAIFPVTCGVATRNLATNRLLDAIVEDLPSPVKHGAQAGLAGAQHSRPPPGADRSARHVRGRPDRPHDRVRPRRHRRRREAEGDQGRRLVGVKRRADPDA
jgi:elongation factor G